VYLDEAAAPVAVLGAGDHFGEGALLRNARRSASLKAEEPLDVLVMNQASFAQLTQHFEALREPLERALRGRSSAMEVLRRAKDHPGLDSGRVRDVMSSPVATLPVALTLGEALRRSQEGGKGAYPVVDEHGRMVGLCTRTDFYNAWQKLLPPTAPLAEVMYRPVITVRESDSLTTALLAFLREPIKRLVVVADEDATRPVGMLTPFDLLPAVTEAETAAALGRG
jgi:signal-transduction protein with cAMP-binding, CBS, and nucleotidyltransferase domain